MSLTSALAHQVRPVLRNACVKTPCPSLLARGCLLVQLHCGEQWLLRGAAIETTSCCSVTQSHKSHFQRVRSSYPCVDGLSLLTILIKGNFERGTDGWGARLAHAYSRKCDVLNRGMSHPFNSTTTTTTTTAAAAAAAATTTTRAFT